MEKIKKFLKGVKSEMKMVRWSNKKEMFKFSTATISVLLFFMAFFSVSAVVVSFVMELIK